MSKKNQILFVDDEQPLRHLVKEQLSAEGFAVETADDGDTAIDMIKKHEYDLVLLDIRMPRVSGLDVLKYIRKQKLP
ncbi:MAG TPA: response regulator, partial [Bacteroidota bacterium]|nr:response regulator [Bacteroidota bacterium]